MFRAIYQAYLNLKTLYKIFMVIGLLSIFMLSVGVTGLYFMSKSNESVEVIYENNLKPIRWINLARVHLNANRTNLYHAIAQIGYDSVAVKKYVADMEVRDAEFNENLKLAEEKMIELNDEFSIEKIEELEKHLSKYRDGREKMIAHILNGDREKALKTAGEYRQEAYNVIEYLSAVAGRIQERAEARHEQAKKDAAFAYTSIITMIIAAFVLSIAFGCMVAYRIEGILSKLKTKMEAVAKGDLKVEDFGFVSKSDLGQVCEAFDGMNALLKKLDSFIKNVAQSVEEISASTEEMSASAEQTAQGSQQVADSVGQLAAGSQEQANNVSESLDKINNISQYIAEMSSKLKIGSNEADDSSNKAKTGAEDALKALTKIKQIKTSSLEMGNTVAALGKLGEEIGVIIDLIKGIAGQTNLLALNAAIEAARAGEHGKGFAVVAEEVKKLASQSAGATDKITEMVKEIQSKTSITVKAMNQAVEEIDEGVHIVEDVSTKLDDIATASNKNQKMLDSTVLEMDELNENANSITRMMENVSSITEESAASAEEISSISEEQTASMEEINANVQNLAQIIENLNKQLVDFKV